MSDASLIQTLTLNQASYFTTPTGIDRVKVHNDSGFYLRVYFGLGAPSSATGSGWHGTVSPGASPVLPVVGASTSTEGLDLTNSRTTGVYQGQVIVLPFLPAGASLSSGGVITGSSLCFLTSYYPGEYAEPGGQIDAFIQGGKQARYQALNGATERYISPLLSEASSGTVLKTASGANPFTFTPARCPGLFAWAAKVRNTASDLTAINVHYYGMVATWGRGALAASAVNWHIEAVVRDPTDSFDKAVETLGAYASGDPLATPVAQKEHYNDQPSNPACVTLGVFGPGFGAAGLQSGDIFQVRFVIDSNVGTWAMFLNTDILVDENNQNVYNDRPYVPVFWTSPADAPYDSQGNTQTW